MIYTAKIREDRTIYVEQRRKMFQVSHNLEIFWTQICVSLAQEFFNKSQAHIQISKSVVQSTG